MQTRIDVLKVSPAAIKTMLDMEAYLAKSSIERPLLLLIKMRVSQINGCAYCLDMHSKDARAEGETEQRLYTLDAWRETPFFTDRERAALAWTEAVTLVAEGHVPDEVYAEAREHRHNAHTFVYVLEGSVVMQVKGGKEVTLGPGQTFYESPDDIHTVSKNASDTKPARFLVFFVKQKG